MLSWLPPILCRFDLTLIISALISDIVPYLHSYWFLSAFFSPLYLRFRYIAEILLTVFSLCRYVHGSLGPYWKRRGYVRCLSYRRTLKVVVPFKRRRSHLLCSSVTLVNQIRFEGVMWLLLSDYAIAFALPMRYVMPASHCPEVDSRWTPRFA